MSTDQLTHPYLLQEAPSPYLYEIAHEPASECYSEISPTQARDDLLTIRLDYRLDNDQKDELVDRYLDNYFDLMVDLDHASFPSTKPGEVMTGVPDYVPDGFVDMGGNSSLNARFRNREQIVVDKKALFQKYKTLIKGLLGAELAVLPPQTSEQQIASTIALDLYFSMQYDSAFNTGDDKLGGQKLKLSEVDKGVCRHQALTFQILGQVAGLDSHILKCYRDGTKHAANTLHINGQWYIIDVTNPDYITNAQGLHEWKLGVYKIDSPPMHDNEAIYKVRSRYSGGEHTYVTHNKMYWHIE